MDNDKKIEVFRKAHEDGTEDKLHQRMGGKYIGDLVYGANDGIITTFAIVSAVMGASLEPFVVLVVGFANLVADGLSMAASDYLAVRSEQDYREKQKEIESWEVENIPELEKEEVRQIYKAKGLTGEILEKVVDKITGNKKVWVETMMTEELGLPYEDVSAWKKALATVCAFVVVGFMPLIPFAFKIEPFFTISMVLTGVTLFAVGAARSMVTARSWFRSGLEMLLVGAFAAGAAYFVGWFLSGLGQTF